MLKNKKQNKTKQNKKKKHQKTGEVEPLKKKEKKVCSLSVILRIYSILQPSLLLILRNIHRRQDRLFCSCAHRIKQAIFELSFVFICYFFKGSQLDAFST